MLKLALCDDDHTERTEIVEILREWSETQSDREITLRAFDSPYALLDAVANGESFDIFLLDIILPSMTGITLGERLQALCPEPLLIYLTTSRDYYADAFRLYAFQYICKPLEHSRLFETLDKAAIRCEKNRQNIFSLKTAEGIIPIPSRKIVYVELLAHVCHFYLADGSCLHSQYLRASFDSFIEPLLQSESFVKIHRSFAVNLRFVGKLTSGSLTTSTGVELPVARACSEHVKKRFMEYIIPLTT